MFDLIIRDGKVIDGTGSKPRIADIAVKNGVIVGVGDIRKPAKRTINASGYLVSPGFVDIHTHYDDRPHGTPTSHPPLGTE